MQHRHTSRRRSRTHLAGGLIATLAAASLIASTQTAPAAPADLAPERNERIHDNNGKALQARAGQTALGTVKAYLRDQGVSDAVLASLRADGRTWTFRGVTHLRLTQQVAGLQVYGAYGKAAFDADGRLVHLIENFRRVEAGVSAPAAGEAAALRAAVRDLYPARTPNTTVAARNGATTTFAKDGFLTGPQVQRVAIATSDGGFTTGYLVETWDADSNDLYSSLVSGDATVLSQELRTAQDDYNVFPDAPDTTPQTIVAGPGSGNAQSPAGWLLGSNQLSTNITGYNAHAYLDVVSDNKPDPGGDPVTDGRFVTAADLGQPPTTADNQEVAVQNLFYLNNVIHDALYDAGFTEAAGNFQEDNFGNGGRGSDSVNAEAQDGGGVDNANFATPKDGQNPRMQMYLWNGLGTHEVLVNSPAAIAGSYLAQGATWGAQLNTSGVTGDVTLANDGTGTTSDACEALGNGYAGTIVLADRGGCNFTVKAKNAQNAGAVAVIIANNASGVPFTMGGDDSTVTIPGVMVSQSDGATLKTGIGAGENATVRLADPQPLQRDGDLDSDIVWHEYGHGLTWRMIGRMDGPLAGAIGEGMSDVLSIYANEDDVVGEYSSSDPAGIRTAPYDNYNRTYGDIAGTEVHLDGEVYGAIGWRLLQHYQAAGLSKDVMLADLVDGMNYTPAKPSFEQMRDGILDGLTASGNDTRACMVWDAFAEYGVGVGAKGVVRGPNVSITETFDVPAACQP